MAEVPPCVEYESKLDTSTIKEVKMDKIDGNGQKRAKYFYKFTASMGVEGLLYVIDHFTKNAGKNNFETADKWDNFDEVLDTVAEKKWEAQIANIAAQSRTEARFKTELNKLVKEYTGNDNPRDVLIEYLRSSKCKKPFSKTPQEHSDRMEELIRIANRLTGTEPVIDDANTKKLIFESFKTDWLTDFLKSNRTVATSTLTEIISYMTLCKTVADNRLENKKKRQRSDRNRGGGGSNNNNNSNNNNRRQRQTCHLHPNGSHSWDQCSLNPSSELFRRNNRNNNNSGRGNGNNYSGRGRGNFRGNNNYVGGRGRGGSNYSNNNRNNYSNNNNDNNSRTSYGRGQSNQNGSSQNGNYFNTHNPRDQGDHYHNHGTPDGGWNHNPNNNTNEHYMNHFNNFDNSSYHSNNRRGRWY